MHFNTEYSLLGAVLFWDSDASALKSSVSSLSHRSPATLPYRIGRAPCHRRFASAPSSFVFSFHKLFNLFFFFSFVLWSHICNPSILHVRSEHIFIWVIPTQLGKACESSLVIDHHLHLPPLTLPSSINSKDQSFQAWPGRFSCTQSKQPEMEARSLASLNYLAANPPQYPVNPTESYQEPLTLYISRVPGTRGSYPPTQHRIYPRI